MKFTSSKTFFPSLAIRVDLLLKKIQLMPCLHLGFLPR